MRPQSIISSPWSETEDEWIRAHYQSMDHRAMAAALGRTLNAVRNRCHYLKCRRNPDGWTDDEVSLLVAWYEERVGKPVELDKLARQLGRLKSNVSRKARSLGLTNHRRTYVEKIDGRYPSDTRKYKTREEWRAGISESRRQWLKDNPHPRGALGMKHTDETKAKMRAAVTKWLESTTHEERSAVAKKGVQTRIEKYGTAMHVAPEEMHTRAAGGRRDDLEGRYFRSMWEANYARYLNWLRDQGEIQGWEYEADVFVFHGETRGAITYRPDFKVTEKDGSVVYHEVKGWMDGPSKTRLRRMKKHYPDVTVIVIGESEYKAVSKWRDLIPNWETKARK